MKISLNEVGGALHSHRHVYTSEFFEGKKGSYVLLVSKTHMLSIMFLSNCVFGESQCLVDEFVSIQESWVVRKETNCLYEGCPEKIQLLSL